MASRGSWAKANNPFWFPHAAACYQAHWTRRTIAADVIFDATLMLWARHPLSPEDLRKSVKNLQSLHLEAARRPPRSRYSVRPDSGPNALRAFWSMHAEAINRRAAWCMPSMPKRSTGEQHGACRVCRSARSFAASVAHMARSSRRIRRRNGLAIAASSECPGSIKQRC